MKSTITGRLRRRAVVATSVAALTLAAAACGQKAGVEQQFAAGTGAAPNGTVLGADGQPLAADPGVAGGSGGGDLSGGAAGGSGGAGGLAPGSEGSTAGGAAGGAAEGGNGGGGAGGDGGNAPPTTAPPAGRGDTTGVTADTIKIGVHAPVTGAAAVPQTSFERAVGVYFDKVNRNGGFFGRKVQVFFEDDQFRPDTARAKCKSLAEQEKVFLLIGGAGADQIDACARYAASMGVPYLSAGVHSARPGQASLGSLKTYFALSLTYEQQVPMLARLYKSRYGGQKVGVLTADNDSLDGYHAAAAKAISSAAGSNLEFAERIPKNTSADAVRIGTEICNSGAKVVVWNASPSSMLNVVKSMTCTADFIGPGLTNALNLVAQVGCDNIDGSMFYSPFPGMDVMRRNSEFVNDYRASNGGSAPDDLGAAIYGLERVVGQMLQAAGKNLTREGFMAAIARVKRFETGVYPPTNFSSRFGGTGMHLLQADCGKNEWVTARLNERP